jgi:Fe(3+) dicitrate transport protein
VTYALDEQWMLVGGVHRGFVNPAPGSDASEEKSWSYELGLRYQRSVVQVEAFVFHVDYENLVGTCTASTGGNCAIGDQYDGGSARVRGLEFAASWDPAAHLGLDISLPLSVVYTLTDSEFRDSFDSDFDEWGEVESGDNLPFVSPHQLTVSAGLEGRRWRVHLAANYVDDARSVAGSGPIPVTQRIDARTLIDLTAQYELSAKFSLISGVRNVTDEVYNIGFRPAGARPGMPRSVLAGLRYRF